MYTTALRTLSFGRSGRFIRFFFLFTFFYFCSHSHIQLKLISFVSLSLFLYSLHTTLHMNLLNLFTAYAHAMLFELYVCSTWAP